MKADDIDTVREVMEAPRYAVAVVLDQTIGYICRDSVGATVHHPAAGLWDTEAEAHVAALAAGETPGSYDLEEVRDEEEFRAREDTW
jgi:hypothetical protein